MAYSQNLEEQIIKSYFGNKVGTLLSVGENDGITLSNVYPLIVNGWQGTLIEASPMAFKRLVIRHWDKQGVQSINAALTDFNGEITLYESGEHLGKGDTSLLSTIHIGEMDRWVKEKFVEVTVPAINFETLLGLSKLKTFDFISLDIEGEELTVLRQMDLKQLKCSLLCVEYNGKDQYKYDDIVLPQGFKLIHKNGENLIFGL